MTRTIAFDTHAYVKKLKAVGFTEEQAEAQAEALTDIVDEKLATKLDLKETEAVLKRDLKETEAVLKRDLKETESALKRDMKELETTLKHDMKEMEMRLTIKLGVLGTTGIIAVATLVKIL